MANIDLTKYGITGTTEIVHNPSYEVLFEEETKASNEGYEVGQNTELDTVNVMTGVFTGRSPKDKYIVMDENSKDTVWWTTDAYKNDNHPMTEETWAVVKDLAKKELCNKKLYVVDAFCGANKDTRMAVRFIVEVAWQPGRAAARSHNRAFPCRSAQAFPAAPYTVPRPQTPPQADCTPVQPLRRPRPCPRGRSQSRADA